MATEATIKKNARYVRLKEELITEYGGKCQLCESPFRDQLHFAHKIGFRWMYGASRGRNARIAEIKKYPERFLMLDNICHRNYDRLHPLTIEEIEMSLQLKRDYVPF